MTKNKYLSDSDGKYIVTYVEKCKCGKDIRVTTQRDRKPEYHTCVYIECQKCGNGVGFQLPVN